MVLFIYGEDDCQVKNKIHQVKEKFAKEGFGDINIDVFDGKQINPDEISKACEVMPFLSKKRLIIVFNLISQNKSSELKDKIIDYMVKVPDTVILVFAELIKPDGRDKLFNALKKKADKTWQMNYLEGAALSRWIDDEVKKENGSILPDAKSKLASYVGNNLWQMKNEIGKLLSYSGGKPIGPEAVDELVIANLNIDIFALVDSIGQKNAKNAIEVLHKLIADGQNELYILGMIVYQIRNLLLVGQLHQDGLNPGMITHKIKRHPFVVKKTLSQLENFTLPELAGIYQQLLDTDLSIKRGKLSPSVSLDLLIARLCEKSAV